MRAFIQAHPDWLTEARLPAYAPDLNAVRKFGQVVTLLERHGL